MTSTKGQPAKVLRSGSGSKTSTGKSSQRTPNKPAAKTGQQEPLLPSERRLAREEPLQEVCLSYKWGSATDGQVEALCDQLQAWGYQVVRDRGTMKPGDLVSTFMKRIGRGECVLVILSAAYLRSPYCMTELYYVYQRSLGEKEDLLRRIVPLVLEDVRIDDWRTRRDHARYWKQEHDEMRESLEVLGVEDFRRYRLVQGWYTSIGDMLAFLADQLAPRGFDALAADDFRPLQELLERSSAAGSVGT